MSDANGHYRPLFERFFGSIERVAPLSKEAARGLADLLEAQAFSARSHLLRAGERAKWVHYITEGLVRELYVAFDGAEHTRSFIAEGDLTGSLIDLVSSSDSITFIEAIEATTTLSLRYGDLENLAARFPDIQLLMRRWAEQIYVRKARREHDMLALTAAARYDQWLAWYPHIDRRVRRRDLASYLGVTPEHLSRLRRRKA